MQRWIWVVVAVCVSTSVYFTIRYGLRPKPIPVMSPTEFQELEQVGVVIYKRLRQNIRAERVVVLGTSPGVEDDAKIWDGLLKAAEADGEKIYAFPKDVPRDENFLDLVMEKVKAGHLVIVHGLTPEVSHLVDGSLSKQLDRRVRHPVLSISTMRLAIKPDEYDDVQTQCLDTSDGETSLRRLDCAAQRVARKYLKRRLAPEKIWAVMERHGLKEFLVFIHRP